MSSLIVMKLSEFAALPRKQAHSLVLGDIDVTRLGRLDQPLPRQRPQRSIGVPNGVPNIQPNALPICGVCSGVGVCERACPVRRIPSPVSMSAR